MSFAPRQQLILVHLQPYWNDGQPGCLWSAPHWATWDEGTGCSGVKPYPQYATTLLNIVFKASLFLGHSSESGYQVLLWWVIYTDWGKLWPIPTSPQKISLGWRTRTRTLEPKEWGTKDWKPGAESVSKSNLREKEMSKNARRETLEPSILRMRVFLYWK